MTSAKYILSSIITVIAAFSSMAQTTASAAGMYNLNIERTDGNTLTVAYSIDLSSVKLSLNQRIVVSPVLFNAEHTDSVALKPYIVAGRNQYYYTMRSGEIQGRIYHSGSKESVKVVETVPWHDWMGNGEFDVYYHRSACCGKPVDNSIAVADLALMPPVIPIADDLRYINPAVTDVKEFKIEGSAYVSFRVNETVIDREYFNNATELAKITGSIDSVRYNPDATISSITLTGYASPEGPYANNERLSKGRTDAVREYCNRIYNFPARIFSTKSIAEDWDGLKKYLESSSYPNRTEMIDFINSGYPVESRNERFRALFPDEYPYILREIYPLLRHTDYLIKYTVRKYSDVNEISRVLVERPQNLSLNELYLLAASYPVGSEKYNEVFEKAAVLFPNDSVANINAANAALLGNNVAAAEKYLLKAGESADANFARGMYYAKIKDYTMAKEYFSKCNTPAAEKALERIAEIENFTGGITWRK